MLQKLKTRIIDHRVNLVSMTLGVLFTFMVLIPDNYLFMKQHLIWGWIVFVTYVAIRFMGLKSLSRNPTMHITYMKYFLIVVNAMLFMVMIRIHDIDLISHPANASEARLFFIIQFIIIWTGNLLTKQNLSTNGFIAINFAICAIIAKMHALHH